MNKKALIFYQEILKMNDKEKKEFTRIVNKLLKVNYLTKEKSSDKEDYRFIENHFALFNAYFFFMDCELIIVSDLDCIALYNKTETNNLRLRLNESIVLLILRLFYEERRKSISYNEFLQRFHQTGREIKKYELNKILLLFKRYNLIDFDDKQITLFKTIEFAVNIDDINQIYEKLTTYQK